MVLDGASREEVARYLNENFDLEDPGELLDEVWSQADAEGEPARKRRTLRARTRVLAHTNACSHQGGRAPL